MEGDIFGIENERRSFVSSLNKGGFESPLSQGNIPSAEQNFLFLSSFWVELIERIKHTLGSIKNYTQISRGKFSDREFGEYYFREVTGNIEKMDMVLNNLLHYMKVHTPTSKKNTIHHIIEEGLKKHQAKLDEKGMKLFKRFEKDLPETIVPDEQLKYIFNSVFQYAMASTLPHSNMGLSTRSFVLEKGAEEVQDLFKRDGRYVEILVVFTGYKKPIEPALGMAPIEREEASDLLLRFVKEVVRRNHGMMKMGTDGKKTKTFISLKFPVERRKVVYYPTVSS